MIDADKVRHASLVLMSIFLALLLQSALDSFLSDVLTGASGRRLLEVDLDAISRIRVLEFVQLITFLLLLSRFYLGAFRIHSQQGTPSSKTALVDLLGSGVLFAAFYGMSGTVSSATDFWLFVGVAHIIDFGWFAGRHFSHGGSDRDFKLYMCIDVVTIGILMVGRLVSETGIGLSWYMPQLVIVAGIAALSVYDLRWIQMKNLWSDSYDERDVSQDLPSGSAIQPG